MGMKEDLISEEIEIDKTIVNGYITDELQTGSLLHHSHSTFILCGTRTVQTLHMVCPWKLQSDNESNVEDAEQTANVAVCVEVSKVVYSVQWA